MPAHDGCETDDVCRRLRLLPGPQGRPKAPVGGRGPRRRGLFLKSGSGGPGRRRGGGARRSFGRAWGGRVADGRFWPGARTPVAFSEVSRFACRITGGDHSSANVRTGGAGQFESWVVRGGTARAQVSNRERVRTKPIFGEPLVLEQRADRDRPRRGSPNGADRRARSAQRDERLTREH